MPRLPICVGGECDPRFELVKRTFCDNFNDKWESEGAAFAVYLNGEKVVDLWGGYADSSSRRQWRSDTMTVIFSSTKTIGAICIAMLIDRGLAAYDDLVTKYWPEFGQNGKENITIEMVLSHQAGLVYVDGVIEVSDIKDWEAMSKILERQTPNWTPGQYVGYHAYTFGFLVDQLCRRIDPKKRSLVQFFKEEVAIPFDIDLSIGSLPEQEHRIARIAREPKLTAAWEILENPILLKMIWLRVTSRANSTSNVLVNRIMSNFPWMGTDTLAYNNPEIRGLEMVAATGVGTARALAKLHSLVVERKLVNETTLVKLCTPVVVEQTDLVMTVPISGGKGFFFTKNPQGQWLLGHPGFGGQNVKADLMNKVAFAYVCNGMKVGYGDYAVAFKHLQDALYKCLQDNKLLSDSKSTAEATTVPNNAEQSGQTVPNDSSSSAAGAQ